MMSAMPSPGRPVDPVVAKIVELAGGERTHTEVARALGVSRPHWSKCRHGHRTLNREALRRAVIAFPDLLPFVVDDLSKEKAS